MSLSTARSVAWLITYSARRQLRSKKTPLALLFLCVIAIVVYMVSLWRPWSAVSFGGAVVLGFHTLFFLPMVSLMYGTGAVGDERDEKTLVYLNTRPIPRSLLFAGKLAAVLPHVLALVVGGLAVLWAVARVRSGAELDGQLGQYLPGLALSALAYTCFFHFLSAVFRHATILSIVYVFLIEVMVGQLPGVIKRCSISFYTWSIFYEEASASGLKPAAFFYPLNAGQARLVLLCAAAAFLVLGALVFRVKEYRDNVS